MWLPLALLSAITAAFVTIFAKMGVKTLDSTFVTTLRTIIMAILMVFVSLALHKVDVAKLSALDGKEIAFILLSAIAGAASLLFYFAALKAGEAGKVSVIDRTSLVFIVVFSAILFGEKFSLRSVVGVLLVVLGAVLASWK